MKSKASNIQLKSNWDDSPSGKNTPSTFFSGRSTEIQLISGILLNKKSGSILVSAPRGTGKTDLIYKAVEEAKKENKKLLTIVFNANHISSDIKNIDPNLAVLKNLIRRTYSECKNIKSTSSLISSLYNQATSASYEESSSLEIEKRLNEESVKKDTSKVERKFSLNTDFLTKEFQKLYPYILVSTGLLTIDNWAKLAIASLILILGVGSDISIKKSTIEEESNTNAKSDTDVAKAKLAYKKDGSIGNLEHGLKDFLAKLETENYKVVFIIDELDKLDDEPKKVLAIVTSFKGFFNHSDALFIFISDEKVFNYVSDVRKTRGVESTLFNQRIFITKPTPSDMKEYLKKIISTKSLHSMEDFENYVIYQAQLDFYNMPDVLRDLIVSYEKKKPVINWDDIATNSGIQVAVNKQMVITALLEQGNYLYKQASNKSKNDSLIKTAYDIANMTSNFKIPVNSAESNSEERVISQFKVDLARYLTFSGIYNQNVVDENGVQFYEFTPTNLVGTPVTNLRTPLEFEQELINKFSDFNNFILNLYNFKLKLKKIPLKEAVDDPIIDEVSQSSGLEVNLYKTVRQIVKDELQTTPLSHTRGQEELRKYAEDLTNQQANIIRNHTLTYLKVAFEELNMPVWTLNDTPNLPQLVPNIISFINENGVQNIVLKEDRKNQYAIIFLNTGSSLVTNSLALQDLRGNKNIFALELYPNKTNFPNLNEPRIKALAIESYELTPKKLKDGLKGFKGLKY